MASGGAEKRKRILNPVLEELREKYSIERSENNLKIWNYRWSWLIEEYRELEKKGAEISQKSDLLTSVAGGVREKDMRKIPPYPPTTNGIYGWIATRPDFSLNVYGQDIHSPLPLPEEFILCTEPE